MEGRVFEKFQKKFDRANFLQLLSKRYVKTLNEKIFLENMKRKKFYDDNVISFTKEVVSCECHHRVQFSKDKNTIKFLVCSQKYLGSVTYYFISDMECPKKDRPTIRGAVSHFLSFRKPTIYL